VIKVLPVTPGDQDATYCTYLLLGIQTTDISRYITCLLPLAKYTTGFFR